MLRRRKLDDDDDNQDRWLISYADFITLLFAFFVVMYATSTINLNKYRALSSAVVTAFQGQPGQTAVDSTATQPSAQSPTTVLKPLPLSYLYQEKKLRDQEKVRTIGQQLANELAPWLEQKTISIFQSSRGVYIDLQSDFLFKGSNYELTSQAETVLSIIVSKLNTEYRTLQIEAHTDHDMFKGQMDAKSKRWEITAIQAARVTSQLMLYGLPAKQMSAIGLSDTQPVSISENTLAQSVNRHVRILMLTAESTAQLTQNSSAHKEILPQKLETTIPEAKPVTSQ
ncbi:flagellar motor protein MotB [Methylophilus aquaticus]|uniref:Flagellar motor protein MotB n=1 Tax=Methylophilus aquaticus TaxID=1971610 RepID=A0ABT9JQW8_9PROT|nr:flagellar motor protein MotB [Methylophilus aquaticus]MDP8566972.1 flagellar motor protein MotB [Methylophilus aquaticus]